MRDSIYTPSVYIYESEARVIAAEAEAFPHTETGGDLYGTFTHAEMPIVWLASGPGPRAYRAGTEFQQDAAFTTHWQERLHKEFGVQYIGGWHSHHQLGLRRPSGGDVRVAQNYAIRHHRRRNVEIIVTLDAGTKIFPYYYLDAQERSFTFADLRLLPGESPLRTRLGADEASFSGTPRWRTRALRAPEEPYSPPERANLLPQVDSNASEESPIPEVLGLEIKALADRGLQNISVESRGDKLMMTIGLETGLLGVALDSRGKSLKILQVNWIDVTNGINSNIEQLFDKNIQVEGKKLKGMTLADLCTRIIESSPARISR